MPSTSDRPRRAAWQPPRGASRLHGPTDAGRFNVETPSPTDEVSMPENTCPVCNSDLLTGTHNLEKHRDAMYANVDESAWRAAAQFSDEDKKALDRSVKNHPAGRKLPGSHRNGE